MWPCFRSRLQWFSDDGRLQWFSDDGRLQSLVLTCRLTLSIMSEGNKSDRGCFRREYLSYVLSNDPLPTFGSTFPDKVGPLTVLARCFRVLRCICSYHNFSTPHLHNKNARVFGGKLRLNHACTNYIVRLKLVVVGSWPVVLNDSVVPGNPKS